MRVFNLRNGVTVDVEQSSPRWSSVPIDGQAQGISITEHWDGMLDNYYRLMGWDRETGRPLPKTLKAIGLEHVISELWE